MYIPLGNPVYWTRQGAKSALIVTNFEQTYIESKLAWIVTSYPVYFDAYQDLESMKIKGIMDNSRPPNAHKS